MNRLIISTAMTVDGVVTVGEWYVSEGEHDRASRNQFVEAAGMLMGRKTYEGLAGYWPSQTGEWADQLNPMPKFVASRREAQDGARRDLVLIGCGELARFLFGKGLIDELRFWVHPAMWGPGEHPFEGEEQIRLELLDAKRFDSGVTLLRYRPAEGS